MRVGLKGADRIGSIHAGTLAVHPGFGSLVVGDHEADPVLTLAARHGAQTASSVDELFGGVEGWMATPGEDATQKRFHGAADSWLREAGETRPFGRLIDPEEAAAAVVFLLSEESGLMTGSVVDYDQQVIGAYD